MAWTKAKTAIVAGVAALLMAGTATVVVQKISHPTPASDNGATVQFPVYAHYGTGSLTDD